MARGEIESLSALSAFVRAAEAGSFVGAARAIGVSPSAIGKSIARLEERLGVRLFQRSTRHIHLTAEGELFLERCRRLLRDLADAEAELAQSLQTPKGRLRVSLPLIGYRMLVPLLPEFVARYPHIELDLDFNDRLVDVIEEGLDVVIRSGTLHDSRLMARPLFAFQFVIVGSPGYFAAHGQPSCPADLAGHTCLRYRFPSTGKLQEWSLTDAPPELPVSMTFNAIEGLIGAASAGVGLAYLPDFLVKDALADGRLVAVLDDFLPLEGRFSVLWPSSRQLSPKLRVFVDFLGERLGSRQ